MNLTEQLNEKTQEQAIQTPVKAATPKAKGKTLPEMIIGWKKDIIKVIPNNAPENTADSIIEAALNFARQNKSVLRNTQMIEKLKTGVINSAQLGLVPNTAVHHFYISFDPKKGDIKSGIAYQGYMEMAYRNKMNMEAHTIRARDDFDLCYGDKACFNHRPYFGVDENPVTGYYATAILENGLRMTEVMQADDMAIHRKNYGKGFGWDKSYDQMALTVVLKRLLKRLPLTDMSVRIASAEESEYAMDAGFDDVQPEAAKPKVDQPKAEKP